MPFHKCLVADKHIPYTVLVQASTSAGYGAPASDIIFTEEGGKSPNIIAGIITLYVCTH